MAHAHFLWIHRDANIHSEYVTLIAFPLRKMVTRTNLNVMFKNVHCLPCLSWSPEVCFGYVHVFTVHTVYSILMANCCNTSTFVLIPLQNAANMLELHIFGFRRVPRLRRRYTSWTSLSFIYDYLITLRRSRCPCGLRRTSAATWLLGSWVSCRHIGGAEVLLHLYLTSVLDTGVWSSRPGNFPAGKNPGIQSNRRLVGPQSQFWSLGNQENLFSLAGFEPQSVQHAA
jgi:hypothetical protein